MNSPRFTFFGTDEVSVTVLDTLKARGLLPTLIVTRADRPTGRKRILTPPIVKEWADSNKIPTLQPEKFKDIENWPSKITGHEIAVVASYGKIIPQWVLDSFPKGVLNVHPSLLPRYRGPTPFQSALLEGAQETGVTIMLMDQEMDHGEIVQNQKCKIENSDTYTSLGNKLSKMGGEMLVEIIPKWIAGEISPVAQDHSQATYTRKFASEDGFIKPETVLGGATEDDVAYADRQVRALNPEPGTFTRLKFDSQVLAGGPDDLRIKILSAKIESGKLVPIRVVPAGKKEMFWEEFRRGKNL